MAMVSKPSMVESSSGSREECAVRAIQDRGGEREEEEEERGRERKRGEREREREKGGERRGMV